MVSAAQALAGPIAVPHPAEACYGSQLHCFSHEVDEACPDPFRVCCECRHTFPTGEALLAGHNAVTAAMNKRAAERGWAPPGDLWELSEPIPAETDPARVLCCPHCAHDW